MDPASRLRLPPLRLFAVFESVVRHGSLRAAAAEMNVSQPAISQAVKALEDHVGARLLDRATRPASLTAEGQVVHRAVADGLGHIARALEQVRAMQRLNSGNVTIACSAGTATYWLMPCLAGFYAAHEDISVNVMTTAQGAPALEPGIDLALRYGLGQWSDGRVTRLFGESVVPVCHPDLAARMLHQGLRLDQVPHLHVIAGDDSWLGWEGYCRAIGMPAPKSAGRSFTNYVLASQAAMAGQGVMLGWESNVHELVAQGRLVTLPFPRIQPEEAFYLVSPPGPQMRPSVQILSDWLCSQAAILTV
ncbi:LysR family transcriptional regulator [Xinfangfangia sp. D13-10-4-6]|uniref:LysR substrate-binding domain-containing protein n=1 Tax=Pseudogemmobacter hezensis TaxID=2737662 RepID=UPI0015564615|nr:LysR substrate-binding domain-containing protein [Pseudogemmobacter hezensis]NPD16355.1 LysR family transcriptional regulator [Pseudogemmobacter hezensis]